MSPMFLWMLQLNSLVAKYQINQLKLQQLMKKITLVASVLAICTSPSFANEFVANSKDLPFHIGDQTEK
jgi:hypothetical protein